MTRYDRIAPIFAYCALVTCGTTLFLMGHTDAATYLTGGLVVMALRNRE